MAIAQLDVYIAHFLILGVLYSMVAVGFTLFFGVMNIIQFAQGAIVMVGSFVALTMAGVLFATGLESNFVQLLGAAVASAVLLGLLGILIAKFLVLPLKNAPALNTLLITLMFGTVLREAIRLFYPHGADPHSFPTLLPTSSFGFGNFSIRVDTLLLIIAGLVIIGMVHAVINKTRLGLAIRAVSQDEETAKVMGINFKFVVYATFAMGCAVGALAGVMQGLYYGGVFFASGLTIGVIGFASAIVGGLGSIYGAIAGGFLFAFLQLFAIAILPIDTGYKNVFAFAVVILVMAWRPTGLLAERESEKV